MWWWAAHPDWAGPSPSAWPNNGADVVPSGRRLDRITEVCTAIKALGRRTLAQPSDVRSRESVDALRDAVLEKFGHVEILVNAAGYTQRQATAEVHEEEWNAMMDTHVTGKLRACPIVLTGPWSPVAGWSHHFHRVAEFLPCIP